MNTRFLQSLWKWQRINMLGQRVVLQSNYNFKSYATQLATRCFVEEGHKFLTANSKTILPRRHFAVDKKTQKTSQTKEKLLTVEGLLEKLETQYKLNGHINYEQFQKLLELLEANPNTYNQLLSKEQTLFLLSACGPLMPAQRTNERLQIFQRLWQYLERHSQLTKHHFHVQLQVLQHNRSPLSDFRAVLQDIAKHDKAITASAELYDELLEVACSSGNMRQAAEVLAEMRAQEFALAERNFNALILGHGRNGDLLGCRTVLDNMVAADVPLSTETQTMVIIAHLENNELAKASDILNKFHKQFSAVQVVKMLRTSLYFELGSELIAQLVREFPIEFVSGPEVSIPLKNVCIELLHKGELSTVITIISTLPKPVFNENQDVDTFCVFLLRELFRANINKDQIIEFSRMLRESGKNTRALHIASEVAMRQSPPIALPFLEALAEEETLRPHYFWPLLMYNYRKHSESGIMQTLQHMATLNVECDHDTLKQFVIPNMWVTLQNPAEALKRLNEVNVRPSQVLCDILEHLLARNQLEDVVQLSESYPTKIDVGKLVQPLTHVSVHMRAIKRYDLFAKVIAALVNKSENRKMDYVGQLLLQMLTTQSRLRDDFPAVERFTGKMCKYGLTLAPAAADAIKAILQRQPKTAANDAILERILKTLQKMSNRALMLPSADENFAAPGGSGGGSSGVTSSFIKHPRDMTLNELECHLIELEAKGMNARGVLRRLLQLCVRDGRLDRALEIKTRCDELRVQVSPGMLASIFDMYIKLKDLENAEKTLERIQKTYPGFQVDEHKIIDFAALLVYGNQLEAAKKLLEDRAASQRVIGGDYVIKNVWNFLSNVANLTAQLPTPLSPEQNLTRDTFNFLKKLRYCHSHNSVLGPIVREYLLRGDIHAAVAEFRSLAAQYKHTPLQFELLSLLVRLSNADNAVQYQRFAITVDEAQKLLTELTNVISKVHGYTNMNSALLLAFAESGTDNQLRRLIINPEFRINQELLFKNCQHLGQEGSVQTLLRLARCARGLSRVIDEQGIYNMLLSNFVKSNSYEAAVDLFQRLEADDEMKISQEFLRNLVNLLNVNNIEVPSNIALRAQII